MAQDKTKKLPQKREKRWLAPNADSLKISNIFTYNKITFNIHQWRILTWIMGKMQMKLGDKFFQDTTSAPLYEKYKNIIFEGENQNYVRVVMPVNYALSRSEKSGEVETSTKIAVGAIDDLAHKGIKFFDWQALHTIYKDEEKHIIGGYMPVVAGYKIFKQRNTLYVDMDISEVFWKALLDFSKGSRILDASIMLKLKREPSIKFYMWCSRQQTPMVRPIAWLRKALDCEDTYEDDKIFIRDVIKRAKEELDRVSPFTFNFSTLGELVDLRRYEGDVKKLVSVKIGHETYYYKKARGRGAKAEYVLIEPVYQKGISTQIDARLEQFWTDNYTFSDISETEKHILKETFNFDDKTIRQYQDLILECKHVKNGWFNSEWRNGTNFLNFLSFGKQAILSHKDRDRINRVGYLVKIMRDNIEIFKKKLEKEQQVTYPAGQEGNRSVGGVASMLADKFKV